MGVAANAEDARACYARSVCPLQTAPLDVACCEPKEVATRTTEAVTADGVAPTTVERAIAKLYTEPARPSSTHLGRLLRDALAT